MVFPGATHTRFEHCVGAVHVAQLIVNHVNHNFRKNMSKIVRETGYMGALVSIGPIYPVGCPAP